MTSRRAFLHSASAALLASSTVPAADATKSTRKKLAIVTTEWRFGSHAWHMGERFLVGYPKNGKWHQPPLEVVAAYVDQFPTNDLSRKRAAEFGFTIYPTIAEALRRGGSRLAVDAVLCIGEHGNYPTNKLGQKLYPRYEFFKQIAGVCEKDGQAVPVFNDKHLSWKWEWAREMVDRAHRLRIPFLAGSSLPVTWRMPAIDLPHGAEVEELLCVAMGGLDSYDFHALETIQCMADRRKGGETGVAAVQALSGDAFWTALASGSWTAGGWDHELFHACLCRSQTLAQPATYSDRYPTLVQMREWVKKPVAFRIEYRDGTKATMLLMNGLVGDFTFAARLKGKAEPLSTLFYLPNTPNVTYSASLMSKAEELFLTGNAPYPVERTLLTSGILAASLASLASGGQRLSTPHLSVSYNVGPESLFVRN